MSRRALVLNAGFGSLGHAMLARECARVLAEAGYLVETIDVLEADSGAGVGFWTRVYTVVLARLPGLWRFLYRHWARVPGVEAIRRSWMVRRFRETRLAIGQARPSLIVTTHPLATAIAAHSKARGECRSELLTVLGDWHVQPFWCFPQVDRYLAPHERQRAKLVEMGIPAGRVVVAGQFVDPGFRRRTARSEARAMLDLPLDRPVVLAMGGGRGWRLEEMLGAIAALATPVCAVVFCGGEKRREELERCLARKGSGLATVRLLGFVEEAHPYFHAADLMITKPSARATAQAFCAGLPVLAVFPEPGHEEANLEELRRQGAVAAPQPGETLAAAIERMLSDAELLAQTAAEGRKLVALDPAVDPSGFTTSNNRSPSRRGARNAKTQPEL